MSSKGNVERQNRIFLIIILKVLEVAYYSQNYAGILILLKPTIGLVSIPRCVFKSSSGALTSQISFLVWADSSWKAKASG